MAKKDVPRPTAPDGGWSPESPRNPYHDGMPLGAWVGWQLEMAGFHESLLCGVLIEAMLGARSRDGRWDAEAQDVFVSMLPYAVGELCALKAAADAVEEDSPS